MNNKIDGDIKKFVKDKFSIRLFSSPTKSLIFPQKIAIKNIFDYFRLIIKMCNLSPSWVIPFRVKVRGPKPKLFALASGNSSIQVSRFTSYKTKFKMSNMAFHLFCSAHEKT